MSDSRASYPLIDLSLARRLERTEASANAAFVTGRAQLQPESGATWTDVAGAYAMFDGVGSPLTQTFGVGLFAEAGEAEFEALEAFFQERGAEVHHEISPLAAPALLPHLNERGYLPIEFTSVMFRPVAGALPPAPAGEGLRVRRIGADEAELWAQVAAQGWSSESADLVPFILEMGKISARAEGTFCFLAELEGQPVAAGGLSLSEGTALLAGASTIPAARRKGAQRALLEARLRFAAEQGCDLVMIGASPGSASQRNAERQGFRVAYTRIKWHLRPPSA
ncbi:MAG TPA: GNAT family N-acetyltransferase [Longimicrobium sp.]|jgi:GNAT superfamily N-acetyltransferase|uniref:GNAT family N-acetyltransferase n=1 Tax=Longimicrobium sp. TaxID=2029185 RepID=UPI002ED847DD